mgnify:CR=1 FL=1
MRLVGSKTEQDFREELERSNAALQDPESKLRYVLEGNGYRVSRAYVLHWIPEQLEDIYLVLIDGSFLVNVEIEKYEQASLTQVEEMDLKAYVHGLSKVNQMRLAVAQDLALGKT